MKRQDENLCKKICSPNHNKIRVTARLFPHRLENPADESLPLLFCPPSFHVSLMSDLTHCLFTAAPSPLESICFSRNWIYSCLCLSCSTYFLPLDSSILTEKEREVLLKRRERRDPFESSLSRLLPSWCFRTDHHPYRFFLWLIHRLSVAYELRISLFISIWKFRRGRKNVNWNPKKERKNWDLYDLLLSLSTFGWFLQSCFSTAIAHTRSRPTQFIVE